jgi:hypothetical protein
MKKAIINITLALLLFHGALMAIHFFAFKGLSYYHQPVFEQFDLLFKKGENPDFLFLGSSRTHYGVNPLILEKLSNKKVMNAGLEGAKIHEMESVLNAFLSKHNPPEKIFLMLDIHSLDLNASTIYNKIFLSHYLSNDTLYKYLRKNIGSEVYLWKYLPYSIITEFDDYTRVNCLKGLTHKHYLENQQYAYKGYISLNQNYRSFDSIVELNNAFNTKGFQSLIRIVETCQRKNIPLQILQGPYLHDFYIKNQVNTIYLEIEKRLAFYKAVEVQTKPINYAETVNFKDEVHLNETGATRYSYDLYYNFLQK